MAYTRFTNSDIYMYSHIDGYIECATCWLNVEDKYSSIQIDNDLDLARHLKAHANAGHEMPINLLQDILQDDDRYG